MPPAGIEPAIPESERPQAYALERTVTGIGLYCFLCVKNFVFMG